MTPSHDALSAMPGDKITYDTGICKQTAVVKTAGWQPDPKGGRVWTYETVDGELVANNNVVEVQKYNMPLDQSDNLLKYVGSPEELFDAEKALYQSVDKAPIPTVIKTAIHCLIMGDVKNLEVASFLIDTRAKQLRELQAAGMNQWPGENLHEPPFGGEVATKGRSGRNPEL